MPTLITLYTDFGDADAYVAMLKGALLRGRRDLILVDVTHRLPAAGAPEDPFQAALLLLRVCFYYPAGTIHLIGQDAGWGSGHALVAAAGGHYFLAPDSGVLGLVLEREPGRVYAAPAPPTPFLARDLLVPLALRLAAGEPPAALGAPVENWRRLQLPRPQPVADGIRGQVLHVDAFGNLLTNITSADAPRPRQVELAGAVIARHHRSYAEAAAGELFWLWGAEGWLEISLLRSSAASRLGAKPGALVTVR